MDTKSISQKVIDEMVLRIERMIWRLFSSPDVPKSIPGSHRRINECVNY